MAKRHPHCVVYADDTLGDLDAIRAHLTDDPSTYSWSSYHHNPLGQQTPLITPHEQYTLLTMATHLPRANPPTALWCTNTRRKNPSTMSGSTPSNSAHGEANAFSSISTR
jgi:hypothetical protein